jgi:hypothetical protein
VAKLAATPLRVDLRDLRKGLPYLTPAVGAWMAEAGAICLEHHGHCPGVCISLIGSHEAVFELTWRACNEQTRRCWSDLNEAGEFGACGLSFLFLRATTDLAVIERSFRPSGFDYWLGVKEGELFQRKARLEVSCVVCGNRRLVDARVRAKLQQVRKGQLHLKKTEQRLPVYIVVVEFGTPASKMVNHGGD